MIYKKVKHYEKTIKVLGEPRTQIRCRISYLLFGFIPLFVSDNQICGAINNSLVYSLKETKK